MSFRLFENLKHVNIYSKTRPKVHQNVIKIILKFLEEGIPSKLWSKAVDVGCGSGQGTVVLAHYFEKCYGFDVSPAQINEAKLAPHPNNVFYDVSPAEGIASIETNSVQLLTAFTAAHWFDLNKFFTESDRILVNNGVVALVGHKRPDPYDPTNPNDIRLKELVSQTWSDPRLIRYRSANKMKNENKYKDLKFPQNYHHIYRDGIEVTDQSIATHLVEYLHSSSMFQSLEENDRQSAGQLAAEFENKLKTILKTNDLSAKELTYKWEYYLSIGRKIK